MKVTIVDINNIEAFVSLEDGRVLSVPISTIKDSQIGDSINIPQANLSCSSNRYNSTNMIVSNLIDFY